MVDRPPSDLPAEGEKEVRDWHPDEQPTDDGPVNTHFTEAQANSLQMYIHQIKNMLGLREWDIFLTTAAASDQVNASIHPVYGRHLAALSVNKDWFTYSLEVQRNTIVHEILHVIHNRQTEVIRTTRQLDSVWVTFERETELMVDFLATQLEIFFPLPEQVTDGN